MHHLLGDSDRDQRVCKEEAMKLRERNFEVERRRHQNNPQRRDNRLADRVRMVGQESLDDSGCRRRRHSACTK